MAKKFIEHTRKPESSFSGRLMLWMMNFGHNPHSRWGLGHLDLSNAEKIIDIGCGGGKNIKNMLARAPKAMICGMDYSPASVDKSRQFNSSAVSDGRVEIKEASVESIPWTDGEFDTATAFETIYFWPDIQANFTEAARVLKSGGTFMVCNEAQNPESVEKWVEKLKMNVYTGEEIEKYMTNAGFKDIKVDKHKNGRWLCVTGIKS